MLTNVVNDGKLNLVDSFRLGSNFLTHKYERNDYFLSGTHTHTHTRTHTRTHARTHARTHKHTHTHTHTHCAVNLGGLRMVSPCLTSLCETSIVPWEVSLKPIWADQMSLITFPPAREYCSLPVTTTSSNGEQNTCFRELNVFFLLIDH